MKAPCTGYYSVVQYCPDRSRAEAANVGVLLFSPQHRFLKVRTADGNQRLRRFFGKQVGNLAEINLLKELLEDRIASESEEIRDLASLQRFVGLMANELRLTDPRPVRVEEPEADLDQLFADLVGGRVLQDPPQEPKVASALREEIERRNLFPRVRENLRVRVPVIGEEIEVQFAFQNGRLNLIQAKEFAQNRSSDVLREAFKTAAEGHLLFKQAATPENGAGMQLVIVADFRRRAAQESERVSDLLRQHDVQVFSMAEITRLGELIERTAH
jgi:hypothetical protein